MSICSILHAIQFSTSSLNRVFIWFESFFWIAKTSIIDMKWILTLVYGFLCFFQWQETCLLCKIKQIDCNIWQIRACSMVYILRTTGNVIMLLCSNLVKFNQNSKLCLNLKKKFNFVALIKIMVHNEHVTLNPPHRNCPKLPPGKTFFLEAPKP